MKNYLLIATASASLLFSACNPTARNPSDHEKDSLLSVVAARDSSINEFISSFNDVERGLDSVAIKQHIISTNTGKPGGELKPDQKTRINMEISAINNLMERNRKRISTLSNSLKNSRVKNAQLEKTIATLKDQLNQKDMELSIMNDMLNDFHAQITKLEVSVGELTQTVADQTTTIHTAYYVVGKSRDLQREKIIDRKGGLLGIGRTSKITNNIDNSKFNRIDYAQTVRIAIDSKEMKIVTSHPSDSYTLEKDKKVVKVLVITDPEKFWSASKYLVIVKG